MKLKKEDSQVGLDMKIKRALINELSQRYQKGKKKEKGNILNELIKFTNYNRKYALHLLSNWGKKILIRIGNTKEQLIVGEVRAKARRIKKRIYDEKVFNVLKKIWQILNYICGKRLAPYMKEIIPVLEKTRELEIEDEVKNKLLKISADTIDRLLKNEKKKMRIKNRSKTKPGTLLKNQIPIRTYEEWDDKRPGFCEMDLVAHDGGHAVGEYNQTLDTTDIATGWTETVAVLNKSQYYVFKGIKKIRKRMPFSIIGLDSDNGSEFINDHLYRFCTKNKISFTRSRAYKKNDNCYVEQKNYSIVRKYVGYSRYEGENILRVLNCLYKNLRLYTNYFQPVMKLINKERIGSKTRKKYDMARTPYQRVLESPYVAEKIKEKLKAEYEKLNPIKLLKEITRLQNKLLKMSDRIPVNKMSQDNVSASEYVKSIIEKNRELENRIKSSVEKDKIQRKKIEEIIPLPLRMINFDFTIQHKGRIYQLKKEQPVKILSMMKVEIEEKNDGRIRLKHNDKYLNFCELKQRPYKPKYAIYPKSLTEYYKDPVFVRHSNYAKI